ncbi:MAG TPA: gamma carbonic anhydrase family protein [Bryobacteraceae bacterium]|jgi:carbonic anhydrase/acetyltransferase-like protein (isoleucine patch superfamily)|nr:gamma carbonic anhydrase family protein [Bryobacteraceae bacterium]
MQLEHLGIQPRIHESARVAPNAVICGDVTIGANCSIGFGAVLTAESGPIAIGDDCVVMDTAVLRGVRSNPLKIANRVLVGPRAYLSGCELEDDVFLATGTAVFNGARIGTGSEVRINGVVHVRTVLPPNTTVPIGWIALGNPVEILPPDQHERIWSVQKPLDFPRYVFGVPRPPEDESFMPVVMPRYAALLGRHKEDRILE